MTCVGSGKPAPTVTFNGVGCTEEGALEEGKFTVKMEVCPVHFLTNVDKKSTGNTSIFMESHNNNVICVLCTVLT